MSPALPDITNHWAKNAILALSTRNIVHGFPDGSFRPDASLTRAEFAALMYRAFPATAPVRPAVYFPDVPKTHWAYSAITWGYERGLFSGYPEGYFQPDLLIPRMQVVSVLVTALHLPTPAKPDETLNLYFDDAAEIPNWVRWAIAAAVIDNRIVNYPGVRKFRPTPNTPRGELSALLCLSLGIEAAPRQYTTWNLGIYDIKGSVTVPFERWQGCARLLRDIQVILSSFRLYSGAIDGRYTSQTEQGLTQFCNFYGLNAMKVGVFDATFAGSLTNADPVEFILAQSKDRQKIYNLYLSQEAGFNADKLAFLDRGIKASPYQADIPQFPSRLAQKPDGVKVASLGANAIQAGTNATITFDLYPARGEQPSMGTLDFLHSDVQQACIGMGSFVDGMIRTHWLGKNPFQPAQLWSTTKILPLLHVVCRANAQNLKALVKDCLVRSAGSKDGYGFYNLAVDLVSYANAIGSSNAIAALFKQFSKPGDLQNWVQSITGNYNSEFQGRYGEPPLIANPELWSQSLNQVLLSPAYSGHSGNNALSTYDLARFMSLVGWHIHLFPGAQLPTVQWSSLETVVRALGNDPARYIEVAIEQLGLAAAIESPVILSKLGFGRSESRDRTELSYVAFVQFVDKRPRSKGKPGILRTLSLSLLGVNANGDANEEARQLDARMAAEITEIIRRVVAQELV